MQAAALELVRAHDSLRRSFELLPTAKGVAEASALALLGELLVLPEGLSARQWVAMAGLDPRHHQSGTSVCRRPRLSKAGSRHLRMALYMPALSAATHEPHLKAFYQKLTGRGLAKLQALCAVMRKLLTGLHAVLKNGTPFDAARLFAQPKGTHAGA